MSSKNFDEQLRERILDDVEGSKGHELASAYEHTQAKLQQEVYEKIPGAEPSLSDHGPRHVANVQQNAIRLLSNDGVIKDLSGIEMYCLGMCILFHDAGNIFGRKDHHNKIAQVFDSIRGKQSSLRHEKALVMNAASAHTGTTGDGSHDTLKGLPEIDHLQGEPVRLRELAAILRFADELAEGPQRTSDFMKEHDLLDPDSEIYHDYAASTNLSIQRDYGRIALTYEIMINMKGTDEERRIQLSKFLDFIYRRIIKLDQERRYACYYSKLLVPFKSTDVTFRFHCDDTILYTGLLPLKLTDIVVPGDHTKGVTDIDAAYSIEALVADLLSKCPGR